MRTSDLILLTAALLAAMSCIGYFMSDTAAGTHLETVAAQPMEQKTSVLADTFGADYIAHAGRYPQYQHLLKEPPSDPADFADKFVRQMLEDAGTTRLNMWKERGYDKNEDRNIDEDQLEAFRAYRLAWSRERSALIRQNLLQKYDANQDNTLQHSEMKTVCRAFAEVGPKNRSWSLAEKGVWNARMKLRMLAFFDHDQNGLLDSVESGIGNMWMRMGATGKQVDIAAMEIRSIHGN